MTTLNKLFDLRKSLVEFEENLGLSNLSDLEKAMLEFIGNTAVDKATLTDIIQDEYFKNYSLSTIKRGLVSLIDKGFVIQEFGKEDRRKRILKVNLA